MKKLLIIFIALNSLYIYCQNNNSIDNNKKKIILTQFNKYNIPNDSNIEFYINVFNNLSKILINELSNEEYKHFIILDKDIENYIYEEVDYQTINLNKDNARSFSNQYNADYIIFNKLSRNPLNEYFISSKMISISDGKIYLNEYEKIDNYEEFVTNPDIVLKKIKNLSSKISYKLKNK